MKANKDKVEERIAEIEGYKEEALKGYIENIGNAELESMNAALNLAYEMEIYFLTDLLKTL